MKGLGDSYRSVPVLFETEFSRESYAALKLPLDHVSHGFSAPGISGFPVGESFHRIYYVVPPPICSIYYVEPPFGGEMVVARKLHNNSAPSLDPRR